ncbi:MAG TPA: C4-type zinc ribbon domain-containing protein [Ktedonobacteraceae bacterium]|nr:C4-type zinc ribbon domain-containing protein [Ktedonobacteraceae bacterium]
MSTTQIAAALYQLQQLDLELERLAAEQQVVVKSLQGNARLQELRIELNSAQQQLRSRLQAQKEAEWALEELTRRLGAQEQRLYSGMVSNPKELNALQQEIQHLRTQQGRQEDTYLEVMEATESLQEESRRKAETLQQAEEAWTRESATMLARRDQLEVRKQELQARRTQMLTSIDAGFISRYEAMRRAKQGRAISKVEQNSCQWCRVILTPSELQRVRVSSQLQTCTNCGRILYYDR